MFSRQERLKRQARKHYETYHYEREQMSCGRSIGEVMNPRMSAAKQEFNATMDELAKIDPDCPASRL